MFFFIIDQIKQEDDILLDSIIDHNQFWNQNQILTPSNYYLPINSSSYEHLSTSDIDNSNSSKIIPNNNNNNNGQSRKDKSLGLLCQR